MIKRTVRKPVLFLVLLAGAFATLIGMTLVCGLGGAKASNSLGTVSVTNASGLVSAISGNEANANGGTIVEIAAGTYKLSESLNIQKSITLRAADAANKPVLKMGASVTKRHFEISGSAVVRIEGLIIEGNYESESAPEAQGGGLAAGGTSKVTVTDSVLLNCRQKNGGNIYLYGSTNFEISNCEISDNCAAKYGGGFYITDAAAVNIEGCGLTGNTASSAGALYMNGGNVTLTGSLFYGNSSALFGDNIIRRRGSIISKNNIYDGTNDNFTFAGMGDAEIPNGLAATEGSTLDDVSLSGFPGFVWDEPGKTLTGIQQHTCGVTFTPGSANEYYPVRNFEVTVSVTPVTQLVQVSDVEGLAAAIGGNESSSGGTVIELAAGNYTLSDPVVLSKPITIKKAANAEAPVLYLEDKPTNSSDRFFETMGKGTYAVFEGIIFQGCYLPNESGNGGIAVGDETRVVLRDCTVKGGQSTSGGGVYIGDNARAEIINCKITGNVSWEAGHIYGGGIYIGSGSVVDITASEISGNRTMDMGGGIFAAPGSKLNITGSEISGNIAGDTYFGDCRGGGLFLDEGTDATITDSKISGNTARDNNFARGGGIYAKGILTVSDSEISDNTINESGAGVYIMGPEAYITRCVFRDNEAVTLNGGGVFSFSSKVFAEQCEFYSNTAAVNGGGMYLYAYNTAYVYNCVFKENSAGSNGGGIFDDGEESNIYGSVFYGNSANRGGGVYCMKDTYAQQRRFWFNTFTANVAGLDTGGIYADDASQTEVFYGNLVIGNTAPNIGVGSGNAADNRTNLFDGGLTSDDVFDLTKTAANGLKCILKPYGAATDKLLYTEAGLQLAEIKRLFGRAEAELTDLEGNPRRNGQYYDFGAYELDHVSPIYATIVFHSADGSSAVKELPVLTAEVNEGSYRLPSFSELGLVLASEFDGWSLMPGAEAAEFEDAGIYSGLNSGAVVNLYAHYNNIDPYFVTYSGLTEKELAVMPKAFGGPERYTPANPKDRENGIFAFWAVEQADVAGTYISMSRELSLSADDYTFDIIVTAVWLTKTDGGWTVPSLYAGDMSFDILKFAFENAHFNDTLMLDGTYRLSGPLIIEKNISFVKSDNATQAPLIKLADVTGRHFEIKSAAEAVFDGIVVEGNYDPQSNTKNGGGVAAGGYSKLSIKNSQFRYCKQSNGGNLYIYGNAYAEITDSEVFGNYASNSGGGLYVHKDSNAVVIATDTRFYDNKSNGSAYNYGGGGFYMASGAAYISGCSFKNNTAVKDGAGLYNYGGRLYMYNCLVEGNTSKSAGGGLADWSDTYVYGTTFSANTAVQGGGLYKNSSGNSYYWFNTVAENTATLLGGGLAVSDSHKITAFYGNIVAANKVGASVKNIHGVEVDGAVNLTSDELKTEDIFKTVNGNAVRTYSELYVLKRYGAAHNKIATVDVDVLEGIKAAFGFGSLEEEEFYRLSDREGNLRRSEAAVDFGATELQIYSVIFSTDGGGEITKQEIEAGDTVMKPEDPEKKGPTFAGWYKDSECTEVWDFDTDTVTEHTTLYAKWVCTVTFDASGGSYTEEQTVQEGSLLGKPADPEKEGFDFAGWYKDSECTEVWDFDTDTVTEHTTLYAKWTPEKKNLSGGVIAGIVVGSLLAAGLVGFSVFWFAIKKKSFADIKNLFKKGK